MINKKYLVKKSRIIFDDYIQFIVTALGLVSALSWNSAFQKYFEQSKYLKEKGPWIYALGCTLLIFILITTLNFIRDRYIKDVEKEENINNPA